MLAAVLAAVAVGCTRGDVWMEVQGGDLSINGSSGILGTLQRLERQINAVMSHVEQLDAVIHVTEWGCWGVCEGGCGLPGVRRRVSVVPAGVVDSRACDSPCFPDWRNLTAPARAQFMDALRKLVAPGECISGREDRAVTLSLPSGLDGFADQYEQSVLAPNGAIYFPPMTANRVLKLNPASGQMVYIGADLADTNSRKFRGAVLGTNGIVYGIPHEATVVLRINPVDDSVTTFGSVGFRNRKWVGGVLGPNGAIYGMPFDSLLILRINTTTDSISTLGLIGSDGKYAGGVLAPNGLIYGIPWQETRMLVINPETDGTSFIETGASGESKWLFGALGIDGVVYGFPHEATTILMFDPVSQSLETIAANSSQVGGALAPNGLVYLAPWGTLPGVHALNTTSRSITRRTTGTISGYSGGVKLAPQGALYFSSQSSPTVLRVDFPYLPPMSLPMDALLSPFLN
jgi:hypothetical protein